MSGHLGGVVAAADPDNPPSRCFQPDDQGRLPTCTFVDGGWERSYDGPGSLGGGLGGDLGDPSSAGGAGGGIAVLVVLVLLVGVAVTVWKVTTARRMAREAGMDEGDATRMSLLTDDGFEATYLASSLRDTPRPATPAPRPDPPAPAIPGARDRLAELQGLREADLITEQEYTARRRAVLDDL